MNRHQRHGRVRRRLGSAAFVVASVAVGVAGLPQASAAPSVAAPSAPVVERAASHRIDRSSRTAVREAYLDRLVPALQTPTGWTGSTANCQVGSETAASRRATRNAVNFYRAMVGIGPVTLDQGWSAKALRAALMMDAADALSHYPASSWPCSTTDGIVAAGRSNLFWSSCCSGAQSVPAYIIDDGSNNAPVGHRRWLLNPEISRIGVGSTHQANAIWVVPEGSDPGTSGPNWIAWPPAGHVPMPLVVGTNASGPQRSLGRWSLSTRSTLGADFSAARVRARLADGTRLSTTIEHRGDNSYRFGSALVWNITRPTGAFSITKPVSVKVSVSNIRVGGSTVSRTYTVRLFPLFAPEIPSTTLSAGTGRLDIAWSTAKERGAPVTGYTVRVYADNPYETAPVLTRRVSARTRSLGVDLASGKHYYAFVFAESAAGTSATPPSASSRYVP